jgi:nitrate/nitrite-specific signal transduction histidine kinase
LSERLPPDLEASACFIVAEALTNVVKHAQATRATVTAAVDDGALTLEVRDDGVGGANPEGHGLVGIADRGRRARRSAADRNRGRRRDGCGCLVAVVDWVAARVGRSLNATLFATASGALDDRLADTRVTSLRACP